MRHDNHIAGNRDFVLVDDAEGIVRKLRPVPLVLIPELVAALAARGVTAIPYEDGGLYLASDEGPGYCLDVAHDILGGARRLLGRGRRNLIYWIARTLIAVRDHRDEWAGKPTVDHCTPGATP